DVDFTTAPSRGCARHIAGGAIRGSRRPFAAGTLFAVGLAMTTPSLTLLIFLLIPTEAALAAPGRHWESAAPVKPEACVDTVTDDPAVDRALGALTFDVGGQTRPISEIRFEGASTIKEPDLWTLVGGRPEKLDPLRATTIVRRLA